MRNTAFGNFIKRSFLIKLHSTPMSLNPYTLHFLICICLALRFPFSTVHLVFRVILPVSDFYCPIAACKNLVQICSFFPHLTACLYSPPICLFSPQLQHCFYFNCCVSLPLHCTSPCSLSLLVAPLPSQTSLSHTLSRAPSAAQ